MFVSCLVYLAAAGSSCNSLWPFWNTWFCSLVCGRLADHRELLAPAVEHWQQVQQLDADFDSNKLQLLTEQQRHGSRLLQLQTHKVS